MEIGSNIVATEHELVERGFDLDSIQESLTLPNPEYSNIMRFGKGRFYSKVPTHLCYLKKDKRGFILPRYYFGEPDFSVDENKTISGRKLTSTHSIKLRDYQSKFINDSLLLIESSTGILLEASCGSGKTVMAIYLSYLRGVQTMVLVPTYYLARQWEQRIKETTTASVVILQSKDKEIPTDRDFTIVCTDLFTCRVLPQELINNIGHIVIDEGHRIGAETYIPILDEIPALYRTALTATFRRADGVHRILKYHFGEHLKMVNRFPRPLVYAVKTGVKVNSVLSKNRKHDHFLTFLDSINHPYVETKGAIQFESTKDIRCKVESLYKSGSITKTAYREIDSCLKKATEMPYSVVDSYLNEHSGRRKTAIRVIQECLDAGRTVLFLSKRKDTLKALHKYFAKYKPMLIVSETNERSDEDEKYLQESCPLIFGVTQLAKEGLDIDRLDTLIIHLPLKDTEQAIGRISRLHENKKFPIALYLLDDCPVTYAVYNNAKKFLKINAELKGERTLMTLKTVL